MSEYQYYRFECTDSALTHEQKTKLRDISSRAEISNTAFFVYYHYSDLRGDPIDLMQRYFDIGFYYANWGHVCAYIKLPPHTLPDDFCHTADEFTLQIYQGDDCQLLVFIIEEYEDYLDDEDAEDFLLHLKQLRQELLHGDFRLLYLPWLSRLQYSEDVSAIPLINLDFVNLTPAQQAFVNLFDSPPIWIRALSLLLQQVTSQQPKSDLIDWPNKIETLTTTEKDRILSALFEDGNLTREQALSIIRKDKPIPKHNYQHEATAEQLAEYYDQAKQQLEKEWAHAKAVEEERLRLANERRLEEVFAKRNEKWRLAHTEANRGCASGYDIASKCLRDLSEAYQFKSEQIAFETRFKEFLNRHQKRPALLRRIENLGLR